MVSESGSQRHDSRLGALRLDNSARCAEWLRSHGPATIAEIAEGTGLSRPTVSDRLAELAEKGLVSEFAKTAPGGHAGGRPAVRFRFRSEAGFVAGVELGKHVDHLLLVDLAGDILWSEVVDAVPTPALERLELLRERLLASIGTLGLERGAWNRLGLSVPAALSPDGLIRQSDLFPEWNGTNVRDLASAVFGVPVTLENDVKAACIAEHRLGAARNHSDVAFVLAWHQVAAGIMIDGALHRGRRFFAGEMGRLSSDARSLESELLWPSMPALVETALAAQRGDRLAISSIERIAEIIAAQIAPIVTTLDPDVVVIGGAAASVSGFLVQSIETSVRAHLVAGADVMLVAAELGKDGPVFGAALLALDETNRDLFDVDSLATVSLRPREHAGASESQALT